MDQDNQFNAVPEEGVPAPALDAQTVKLSLIHISEPTRPY